MSHPTPSGKRLRFVSVEREDFADGRARVQVKLQWPDGSEYNAEGVGTQTTEGLLRACASATLRAVGDAVDSRLEMALVGIKTVRAFDSWVIISAVRAESAQRTYSLIGAQASPTRNNLDSAVRSVLDAVNRVLELYTDPD